MRNKILISFIVLFIHFNRGLGQLSKNELLPNLGGDSLTLIVANSDNEKLNHYLKDSFEKYYHGKFLFESQEDTTKETASRYAFVISTFSKPTYGRGAKTSGGGIHYSYSLFDIRKRTGFVLAEGDDEYKKSLVLAIKELEKIRTGSK